MNREILKKINWEKELELIGMNEEFEKKQYNFEYKFKKTNNNFLNFVMQNYVKKYKDKIINSFKNKYSNKEDESGLYEFIENHKHYKKIYIPYQDRKEWSKSYEKMFDLTYNEWQELSWDFPTIKEIFIYNTENKKIELSDTVKDYLSNHKDVKPSKEEEVVIVSSILQQWLEEDILEYQGFINFAKEQNKFLYEQKNEETKFNDNKWVKSINHVINTITKALHLENKYKNINLNEIHNFKFKENEIPFSKNAFLEIIGKPIIAQIVNIESKEIFNIKSSNITNEDGQNVEEQDEEVSSM